MAERFSLRLGHARALTTVQVVIHYLAPLRYPEGASYIRPSVDGRNGGVICCVGKENEDAPSVPKT